MCEMTSIGEISAAKTTIPGGGEEDVVGDFRSALTTSLTPRLRDLDAAAVEGITKGSGGRVSKIANKQRPMYKNKLDT